MDWRVKLLIVFRTVNWKKFRIIGKIDYETHGERGPFVLFFLPAG